jgi:hypothetical protein
MVLGVGHLGLSKLCSEQKVEGCSLYVVDSSVCRLHVSRGNLIIPWWIEFQSRDNRVGIRLHCKVIGDIPSESSRFSSFSPYSIFIAVTVVVVFPLYQTSSRRVAGS